MAAGAPPPTLADTARGGAAASPPSTNRASKVPAFLSRLFDICSSVDPAVGEWLPDGATFLVKAPARFAEVLREHFKSSQQTFVRQLHIYQFHRSETGASGAWTFSNPNFCRGRPELLARIRRKAGGSSNASKSARASRAESNLGSSSEVSDDDDDVAAAAAARGSGGLGDVHARLDALTREMQTLKELVVAMVGAVGAVGVVGQSPFAHAAGGKSNDGASASLAARIPSDGPAVDGDVGAGPAAPDANAGGPLEGLDDSNLMWELEMDWIPPDLDEVVGAAPAAASTSGPPLAASFAPGVAGPPPASSAGAATGARRAGEGKRVRVVCRCRRPASREEARQIIETVAKRVRLGLDGAGGLSCCARSASGAGAATSGEVAACCAPSEAERAGDASNASSSSAPGGASSGASGEGGEGDSCECVVEIGDSVVVKSCSC